MKNIILSVLLLALITVSCNQKNKEDTVSDTETAVTDTTVIANDPTVMENDTTIIKKDTVIIKKTTKKVVTTKIYACPMHPEVQGKLNSKCSKCGMPLNEPV